MNFNNWKLTYYGHYFMFIDRVLLLTGRDAAPPGNCSLVQVQGIKHDKGQSPSQHYF